jgi:hypothetical protein
MDEVTEDNGKRAGGWCGVGIEWRGSGSLFPPHKSLLVAVVGGTVVVVMSEWQRTGMGGCEGTKNEQSKAVFGATH